MLNDELQGMFQFVLMPIVSAQLLLMVLIYFTIVRKRISALYKWYFCFIATLIFFLIGRSVQFFITEDLVMLILYARVSLLFSVGMPSLLIASAIYTGIKKSYWLYVVPYILGVLFSLAYVISFGNMNNMASRIAQGEQLTFINTVSHHDIQVLAILLLSVIPCIYFLFRAFVSSSNIKDLAVLIGGLIFGLLYAAGTYWQTVHWIYYVGSIVPAICWAWAVFKDINEMKSKVSLLKDELYEIVQLGADGSKNQIDKLLTEIEQLSTNNIVMYKLRLKEILSHLTDNTIEAGGDKDSLLLRYAEHDKVISQGENVDELHRIASNEAFELSNIIAEIPNQRVERVKQYLFAHYQEDIDIDQLASQVNVSRSYLMREFKKSTNQTINQFLTLRRVEVAKTQLAEHSVTETAFIVGFNNSNYFSTVFKKTTGKTPGQYQQQIS